MARIPSIPPGQRNAVLMLFVCGASFAIALALLWLLLD
jgi:hypothetical protein